MTEDREGHRGNYMQAVFKALGICFINSRLVGDCMKSIEELMAYYK